MQNKIIYQFASAQIANRFLNEINAPQAPDIKAKLHSGARTVEIVYSYKENEFDSTSADLDDLAAKYDGAELG